MRSRIIALVIMLGTIATLCTISLITVTHVKDEMLQALSDATQAAESGDLETARQHINDANQKWEKHEQPLTLCVRHAEIDEMSRILSELDAFLQEKNTAEFLANTKKAETIIHHLWYNELPLPENIL